MALNAIGDLTPSHGARVYLLQLAEELARLKEVELVLLVAQQQVSKVPKTLAQFAVPLRVPSGRSYWQLMYQRRLQRAVMAAQADVYHLPNTLPWCKTHVPTVVTIHDLADLRLRKYGMARTIYRRWVNTTAARRADHVITVSENTKKDIMDLLRIPAHKVTVVPCGVGAAFRPLDRESCKAFVKSRFSIGSEFILAPGGLLANKNVEIILSSFAELKNQGLSLKLVLTGATDSPIPIHLRSQIERLGLNNEVIFTGYVAADEMPRVYNACSVVLYPSRYEGFGLPALEAMACGVPLVTSNVSSLPEVVGDAALLVDPRNPTAIATATRRLLETSELRDRLVRQGLLRVQKLSWRATAEKSLAVYCAVAGIERDIAGEGSLLP